MYRKKSKWGLGYGEVVKERGAWHSCCEMQVHYIELRRTQGFMGYAWWQREIVNDCNTLIDNFFEVQVIFHDTLQTKNVRYLHNEIFLVL